MHNLSKRKQADQSLQLPKRQRRQTKRFDPLEEHGIEHMENLEEGSGDECEPELELEESDIEEEDFAPEEDEVSGGHQAASDDSDEESDGGDALEDSDLEDEDSDSGADESEDWDDSESDLSGFVVYDKE